MVENYEENKKLRACTTQFLSNYFLVAENYKVRQTHVARLASSKSTCRYSKDEESHLCKEIDDLARPEGLRSESDQIMCLLERRYAEEAKAYASVFFSPRRVERVTSTYIGQLNVGLQSSIQLKAANKAHTIHKMGL